LNNPKESKQRLRKVGKIRGESRPLISLWEEDRRVYGPKKFTPKGATKSFKTGGRNLHGGNPEKQLAANFFLNNLNQGVKAKQRLNRVGKIKGDTRPLKSLWEEDRKANGPKKFVATKGAKPSTRSPNVRYNAHGGNLEKELAAKFLMNNVNQIPNTKQNLRRVGQIRGESRPLKSLWEEEKQQSPNKKQESPNKKQESPNKKQESSSKTQQPSGIQKINIAIDEIRQKGKEMGTTSPQSSERKASSSDKSLSQQHFFQERQRTSTSSSSHKE